MEGGLLFAANLKSYRRTRDGGVSCTFESEQEMTSAEVEKIDSFWKQNGVVGFRREAFNPADLPQLEQKSNGARVSPSQYLRSRLYAKHLAQGGTNATFPAYYEQAIYGFAEAVDKSYKT